MAVRRPQSARNQSSAAGPKREHQPRFLLGLFFFVSLIVIPVRAQYRLDAFTADNGLPQNVIRGIHQTSDGYIWIATFDGLARFDGVHFTVFNKSNTPGLNKFIAANRGEPGRWPTARRMPSRRSGLLRRVTRNANFNKP